MTVYSVGDSLSSPAGLGSVLGAGNAFGELGKPITDLGPFFAEALAKAKPGDTFIISAGYNDHNGVINETEKSLMSAWIRGLRERGANVAILGLREEWTAEDAVKGDRYGERIGASMPARNDALRAIAAEADGGTGRVKFIESSIAVANGLPGGEIHGNYAGFLAAAQTVFPAGATPAATPDAATPPPATPADPATPATPQTAEDQREAAASETEENKPEGIMGFFMGIIKWFMDLLGLNKDDETPAPATPDAGTTPPPATPETTEGPEVTPPSPTPAASRPAQAPAATR